MAVAFVRRRSPSSYDGCIIAGGQVDIATRIKRFAGNDVSLSSDIQQIQAILSFPRNRLGVPGLGNEAEPGRFCDGTKWVAIRATCSNFDRAGVNHK